MTRIELELPDEVSAGLDGFELSIAGPNGEVSKRLWYPNVTVEASDEAVSLETDRADAKAQATIGTFESHVRNMIYGVTEGWEYEMEIYYSHFPMQLVVEDGTIVIENFLGEQAPRRTDIHGETDIEVDGDRVYLRGPDKEAVGQTAADIEQLTRIRNKDERVFDDGVYIIGKPAMEEAT